MVEELIRWNTLFEDRRILRDKIRTKYPKLSEQQISFVVGKRYTGWGRLSEKLLNGLQGNYQGQPSTVIEVMRATSYNLIKVLSDDQLGFKEALEALLTPVSQPDITIDEVRALQGSPLLKRAVWQVTKIVRELVLHQGYAPEAIYIEVTREPDLKRKGKHTKSREEILRQLYTDAGISCGVQDQLSQSITDKADFDDRLYLYYLQLGKCLYSGKPLNILQLSTYQIDHILPQSYVKDDSIENRALVTMDDNQSKRDSLMLKAEIQERQKGWWQYLRDHGLMGGKKFANLMRQTVEPDEMYGFISRQLVETSQIIRHVIHLFSAHYPSVRIQSVPARLTSDCRKAYRLLKVRELNDMHHAYDALLACTIGGFTDRYMSWLSDGTLRSFKLKEYIASELKTQTNGIVLGMFNRDQVDSETGELLRNHTRHIAYLKEAWAYKDFFTVVKKDTGSGAFFDQTRYNHEVVRINPEKSIPLRKGLPLEKYGGFQNINPAYIAAITYQKGKKRVGILVNIPIYLAQRIGDDEEKLMEWLLPQYPAVQIIRKKILLNQLVEYQGSRLLLRSCSEARSATQLLLPAPLVELLSQIEKRPVREWRVTDEQVGELIDILLQKLSAHYPIFSGVSQRLEQARQQINALNLEDKGKFVREALKIMQNNGQFGMFKRELPQLGISDNQGRITNKPFAIDQVILIDQSPTGFYEKRRILWDSVPSSSAAPVS